MNPDLLKLLQTGSETGLSLPERMAVETLLIDSRMATELAAWRKMVAFIKSEEMLTAPNAAGFLRVLGSGFNPGAHAAHIPMEVNAMTRDNPNTGIEPSPGYERVDPPPRTPRRRPVPANADLTQLLKRYPGATGFEVLGLTQVTAKGCFVRFVDATGKTHSGRVPMKAAPPAPKAITPTVPASFDLPPARQAAPAPAIKRPLTFREQWRNDAKLQFEFISADTYHHYMTARQNGGVRLYSK